MAILAYTLIKSSIRLLGAYAPGETPPDEDIQDGLEALNMMLDSWGVNRNLINALTKENFTLVAGTNNYTIGSAGTFNTVRPLKIEHAYTRDSNGTDYPLTIIDQSRWNDICTKTTQGRPEVILYDPQTTLGKVYLYPTPETAYTLYIDSWKPIAQIPTSASTITLPPGYERALKYNLAIELAPEYGVSVTDEVAVIAKESKAEIVNINAKESVSKIDGALLYNGGSVSNINRGF